MSLDPISFGGETGNKATVHDGDTVYDANHQGYRLYGINTDETSQKGLATQPVPSAGALRTKQALADIMANEQVTAEPVSEDKYGRKVVILRGADGRDINEQLVREYGAPLMNFGDKLSPYSAARTAYEDNVLAGNVPLDQNQVLRNDDDYVPKRGPIDEVGAGLNRGSKQLGLMFGKALEVMGEVTGVEAVRQKGYDTANEYLEELRAPQMQAQVNTYKDVRNASDAMLFAGGVLGEQLPQLAADAVAAVTGAAAGGGVGAIPAVAGRRAALAEIGKLVAGSTAKQGAERGAFLSMFGQSLGESRMEQEQEGVKDNGLLFATAAAKAGVDLVATKALLRSGKDLAYAGNNLAARTVLGEGLASIGMQSATEGLQTVIDKAAIAYKKTGYDAFSDDNIEEIVNSMIAGGLVAGTATVGGVAANKVANLGKGAQQPAEKQTEQPTEQPIEQPTEQPIEQPIEQPTEQPIQQPAQQPTEQPVQPVSSGVSFGDVDLSGLDPVTFGESAPVQSEPVQTAPVQAEPVQAEPVQSAPVNQAAVSADKMQAKGERAVSQAESLLRKEDPMAAVAFDGPITADAQSDTSSSVDQYEGFSVVPREEGFDATDPDNFAASSEVDPHTSQDIKFSNRVADALGRALRSATAMKMRYKLSSIEKKGAPRTIGADDEGRVRDYETQHGVGSAAGYNEGFIAEPSYQKQRFLRVRFPGDTEWHDMDVRSLLDNTYNMREIDTTEEAPAVHRRVMNQLSELLGTLLDNGIEIGSYDKNGKAVEGVASWDDNGVRRTSLDDLIVWQPTKKMQSVYGDREVTVSDLALAEQDYNDPKTRGKYKRVADFKRDDTESKPYIAELADNLEQSIEAFDGSDDAKKDLVRYVKRVAGEINVRPSDGVLNGKGLLAAAKRALAVARRQEKRWHQEREAQDNGVIEVGRRVKVSKNSEVFSEASGDADGTAPRTLIAEGEQHTAFDPFRGGELGIQHGETRFTSGATAKENVDRKIMYRGGFEGAQLATKDAISSMIDAIGLAGNVVLQTGDLGGSFGRVSFEDGRAIITLSETAIEDSRRALVVIAHELGHAWVQEKGHRVPQAVLAELHAAFVKARASTEAGHVYRKQKGVGFDEWLADQFMAYYVQSTQSSLTPVQKFFHGIAKGLRAFAAKIGVQMFQSDRFVGSDAGLMFVDSIVRMRQTGGKEAQTYFDNFISAGFDSLFGMKEGGRIGSGERRAELEHKAKGGLDADVPKKSALPKLRDKVITLKGKKQAYIDDKQEHGLPADDARLAEFDADIKHVEGRIAAMEKKLGQFTAQEPRDFSAAAFFHTYGGVSGAKAMMRNSVGTLKRVADALSPVWATSIRRLKMMGHHTLGAQYEKHATDLVAEQRLWLAQLDSISDHDLAQLAHGVIAPSVQRLLDHAHKRFSELMPTLGKIKKGYVPRMYDKEAIKQDPAAFLRFVDAQAVKAGLPALSKTQQKAILDAVTQDENAYYQLDPRGGASYATSSMSRSLGFINDADLQASPWVYADKRVMLAGYLTQMTKRATYEKHFGGYRKVVDATGNREWLRSYMQSIPFRAVELGVNSKIPDRMATQKEKQEYFMKASTADLINLATGSASRRGWMRVQRTALGQPEFYVYEPSFRQNEILRGYDKKGDVESMKEFTRIADALSGRLGQDALSPRARSLTNAAMTYENVLTLLFASLSSFPDMVGSIVRSRDMAGARIALRSMAGVIIGQDAKARRQLLAEFGTAHRTTTEQALLAVYGAQNMSPALQKVNDAFFKYTGLEFITAYGRIMATNTAVNFIKHHATRALKGEAESIRYLKELGLTPDEANSLNAKNWKSYSAMVADGSAFPSAGVVSQDAAVAEKIHFAVNQFVDESVVRPDSTQRPVWASDPRFALVWHLKSFTYSYAKVIMKPVFKEAMTQYRKHGVSAQAVVPLLTFALPVMLASALGLRLRELIQYDLPHAMGVEHFDRPSAQAEFDEYLVDVIRRGGIMGPAELAFNAMEADDRKRSALVTLLGPTADHLNTLLQFDLYKALVRSVPVLSQMPEFKALVYDGMN